MKRAHDELDGSEEVPAGEPAAQDAEAFAAKRARVAQDGALDSQPGPAPAPVAANPAGWTKTPLAPHRPWITEARFELTERMGSWPRITGTIKARYEDFLVAEIDLAGKVASLEQDGEDEGAAAEAKEQSGSGPSNSAQEGKMETAEESGTIEGQSDATQLKPDVLLGGDEPVLPMPLDVAPLAKSEAEKDDQAVKENPGETSALPTGADGVDESQESKKSESQQTNAQSTSKTISTFAC
jgi:hypothetical protein